MHGVTQVLSANLDNFRINMHITRQAQLVILSTVDFNFVPSVLLITDGNCKLRLGECRCILYLNSEVIIRSKYKNARDLDM